MRLISGLARRLWLGLQCFRAICVTPAANGGAHVTVNTAEGDPTVTLGNRAGANGLGVVTLYVSPTAGTGAKIMSLGTDRLDMRNMADTGDANINCGDVYPGTDNTHVLGSTTRGWARVYIGTDSMVEEQTGGVLAFRNSGDTADQPPQLGSFTVATLPAPGVAGRHAFASDGLKIGEGVGTGTGVGVYDDGVAWRRMSDDSTVAA